MRFLLSFALAGLIVLIGVDAAAKARSSRPAKAPRAEADAFYQAGMDHYAHGRYPQALAAFREALRRDPSDRAARLAVNRVLGETAMTASEGLARAPQPAASRAIPRTEEDSVLPGLARFFAVERAVGDEREQEGRRVAMEGRIAQLLVERKVSRSLRRPFSKDAELHALSRRLA